MEEPFIEQQSVSPRSVWAIQFVDFGLQSGRGCVARDELGGSVGLCL